LLRDQYGGDYRDVPLAVKAEFFEWALWRYHLTAYGQVHNRVQLPDQPGLRPAPLVGSDTSTWNGALLAALSYQYAVTRSDATLQRITTLLDGLRFYTTTTGRPGCYARCVVPQGIHVRGHEAKKFGLYQYRSPAGETYSLLASPAKGTYNQLAFGYASLLMFAYDDLPTDAQSRVREDVTHLVMHVLGDDYHITDIDGRRTPYGDLTPVVASVGVPFNGQVAYHIVALGRYFPSDDPVADQLIQRQFHRLREKRHAYYKDPHKSLVTPQRVGDNPLVKGMNDRNHVTNAAYSALVLDVEQSRRSGKPLNRQFMFQLGRTMYWSMRKIGGHRNALCNFMWAGILSDPQNSEMIVRRREGVEVAGQIARGLTDGVEQLRRFRLDRFHRVGRYVETKQLHWVDQQNPDDYVWKANPKSMLKPTGAATNIHTAAIDYLVAYWIFRYYELQNHPALADHRSVL
jgi:hypothetical protein